MEAKLSSIRLLLVHHHPIVRHELRLLLERELQVEIVGEATSFEDALRLAQFRAPEAAVIDLQLPGPNGLATARAIRDLWRDVGLVFVSLSTSAEYEQALKEFGVAALVLYERAEAELIPALKECVNEWLTKRASSKTSRPQERSSLVS